MKRVKKIIRWMFQGACVLWVPCGAIACTGVGLMMVSLTTIAVWKVVLFCCSYYFLAWGICILDYRRTCAMQRH